jgi:hypothetical protein
MVNRAIASHREEPRSKSSPAGLEGVRLIPHSQECFLYQVFSRRRIVDDSYDDGPCKPAEAIVEIGHGSWVSSLEPARELRVALPAHLERKQYSGYCHAKSL